MEIYHLLTINVVNKYCHLVTIFVTQWWVIWCQYLHSIIDLSDYCHLVRIFVLSKYCQLVTIFVT